MSIPIYLVAVNPSATPGGPLQQTLVLTSEITGGSSTVSVNGTPVTNPDFNGSATSPGGSYSAVVWTSDVGGDVSAWYVTSGASTAFHVNGVAVSSDAIINFEDGTDITITNPSAGNVLISFTGTLAQTFSAVSNEFLTAYNASTGMFTASTVAYSDITGTPQLPTTFSPVTNEWLNSYDASTGLFTATQPASTNLSDAASLAYLAGATFTGTVQAPTLISTTNLHVEGTLEDGTGSVGTSGQVLSSTVTGTQWITVSSTPSFSAVTTGTNTSATMTVGSGATLTFSGSGVLNANELYGVAISNTAPTTGQILTATSATTAAWSTAATTSYATTIGNGVTTTFTVTHNLNTEDIVVAVHDIATGEMSVVDVDIISTTQITLTYGSAPTSDRVVVLSNGGNGSSSSGGGGIYPTLTPPVSTNFTWNNPSSFPETTTDYPTKMLVVLPTIATGLWLVQNAALPATPYTVDIGTMYFASNNINVVSILLSNSGLTDARVFGSRVDSDAATGYGAWTIVDQSWSGPTAPGTENVIYTADGMSASQHIVFVRVTNDGTNLNIYWSANGENYILLETILVSGLGFTPASTGIVFYNTSGAMNVWCYHWLVSNSILPQNS